MMANIKLVQYDFRQIDRQIRRKNSFKENFVQYYRERLEFAKEDNYGQDLLKKIPDPEKELVDRFLKQFVLACNEAKNNRLDMKLAMKAVPPKITTMNEFQCALFHYENTKSQIIKFHNDQ